MKCAALRVFVVDSVGVANGRVDTRSFPRFPKLAIEVAQEDWRASVRAAMDLLEEPRAHPYASEVPRRYGFGVVRSWWEVGHKDADVERAHREVDQAQPATKVVRCGQGVRDVSFAETVGHHDGHTRRVINEAGLAVAEVDDDVVRKLFSRMPYLRVVPDFGPWERHDRDCL